jgi:hypothetical protein
MRVERYKRDMKVTRVSNLLPCTETLECVAKRRSIFIVSKVWVLLAASIVYHLVYLVRKGIDQVFRKGVLFHGS